MTTYSLTDKQSAALDFIRGYIEDHGKSPSFDEIKDGLGIKSKSGVHRLVTALVERGHLVRMPNRARTLALPNVGASSAHDMHLVSALTHLSAAKSARGWLAYVNLAIEHIEAARKV